ncbi:hypothetical protein BSKO_01791 [Bryopsis sp. KO-2023]|nr:hypothetical protein BSKO_01791 [Bryopsis sp. KO-2023]
MSSLIRTMQGVDRSVPWHSTERSPTQPHACYLLLNFGETPNPSIPFQDGNKFRRGGQTEQPHLKLAGIWLYNYLLTSLAKAEFLRPPIVYNVHTDTRCKKLYTSKSSSGIPDSALAALSLPMSSASSVITFSDHPLS